MANHHTRENPVPTRDDRTQLEHWVWRPKTDHRLALRARIVLLSAQGLSDGTVARKLDITRQTVNKWRRRFLEYGCDGLMDEPRSGKPRTVTDEDIKRVIVATLEQTPSDGTRTMAAHCGLSPATVNRIWRTYGLQPHRTENLKLSNDQRSVS